MCVQFWREKLVTWSSVDTSKAGCLVGPKGGKIENLLSNYPQTSRRYAWHGMALRQEKKPK